MSKRAWWVGSAAVIVVLALLGIALTARSAANGRETSAAGSTLAASAASAEEAPLVTLYKNPTCACCADWAEHMRANGFRVDVKDGTNLAGVRQENGVPFRLASCHTAVVDGYAIEGHVPADLVHVLLAERPEITGLAVPGMPPGVPGMPDPGPDREPYDVLPFQEAGSTYVYATR